MLNWASSHSKWIVCIINVFDSYRLWRISMSLRVFLMLTHMRPSWPMTCSLWWRKRSQRERYCPCVHAQACLSFVPLHFFWMLNMILFTLSGAHQFLANYRTAEEVSGLPWNTYWWRFYHQVWRKPWKGPWRYSGQFLTLTTCRPCLGLILSVPLSWHSFNGRLLLRWLQKLRTDVGLWIWCTIV